MMNTRISVSMFIVLAVGVMIGSLFSRALPPAQAQTQVPASQSLDAKVAKLEFRLDSLQVEVNQLRTNKAVLMGNGISPFYQPKVVPVPRLSNIPPSQVTLLGQTAH